MPGLCNLEALSFSNSFSNVDGVRLNNNKIRLAWKVHEDAEVGELKEPPISASSETGPDSALCISACSQIPLILKHTK